MRGAKALSALVMVSACAGVEPTVEPARAPPTPRAVPAAGGGSMPPPASENPIEAERRIKPAAAPPDEPPPFAQPLPLAEPLAPRADTRAIVLMYHGIDMRRAGRSVRPWELEEHIRRLRANHVEIIALSRLIDFLEGAVVELPRRVAVLTIDDGEVLFHKYAWPILREHAVPFALGIITEPTELAEHAKALSWAQLGEMVASGLCEIASHGHTHTALTALDAQEAGMELDLSRRLIEAHTGFVPQAFIYPLGAFDEDVEARVAEAGYRAAFTAVGQPLGAGAPRFRLARFNMERNTPYESLTLYFERPARVD
jgi:peptidoglycan/xylan/chitin deacetylase (PgdA/CDA1 family)